MQRSTPDTSGIVSSDPVIQGAILRLIGLRQEADRLSKVMTAYKAERYALPSKPPEVAALEHYTMSDKTECGCSTCFEWNLRRDEFIRVAKMVPKGHNWSVCGCGTCRFIGRIHFNYLAAVNKRDLVIETSFHAHHHSPFGEQIMRWLDAEMANPRYTVDWCAKEMAHYALEWWFERCEKALGPAVSGVVFRGGGAKLDFVFHFESSLLAQGSIFSER